MNKKIFAVHKHEAKTLHYDFRLEIEGFLKSWAIPKGPSSDHTKKRLAIETEDHPLSYKDFEGVIEEGGYGAGTVMLWDSGTYENVSIVDNKPVSAQKAYESGQIKFKLNGKKMKGGWVLIKTTYMGKSNQWLLIKEKDEFENTVLSLTETFDKSVKTNRTIDEIKQDRKV